ncbi:hypothetical protein ACQP1G_24450 [Nocardia sp. CA-107356]|uniref:hypothetical protein n=1 Tax=Nocardia sp. CA-107356 TaxID=3239972 RepID=UPI003D8D7A23
MSIEGIWDLIIATPVGRVAPVIELRREGDAFVGFARGTDEEVPLHDVVVDGNQITWTQSVTRPMRLNLVFAVTIDGDTLTGTSKAGRLPSSKVTGSRRPAGG